MSESSGQDDEQVRLRHILFGIAFLMGFVFLVSFTVFYVRANFGVGICSKGEGISLFILILSSMGVFVGTVVYYFFSRSRFREKRDIKDCLRRTLDFLEADEKKIMIALIDNGGVISQSRLSSVTGLDAVRVFRKVSRLEAKGIISRQNHGMTKKVMLCDEYNKLFLG